MQMQWQGTTTERDLDPGALEVMMPAGGPSPWWELVEGLLAITLLLGAIWFDLWLLS